MKEIRIRNLDDKTFYALQNVAVEKGYESVTIFMKDVIEKLTEGMTIPENNLQKIFFKDGRKYTDGRGTISTVFKNFAGTIRPYETLTEGKL